MEGEVLDYERVIESNIQVHRIEAKIYDSIHEEIYNNQEQERLRKNLDYCTQLIKNCTFKAFDFGAGTGNVTLKLLNLGFKVVAVDISPEMCEVLKNKNDEAVKNEKLKILNVNFDYTPIYDSYDLITCYSVLHHLPEYKQTLRKLSRLVKLGGVLFIDHEGKPESLGRDNIIDKSMLFLHGKLVAATRSLHPVALPNIDYTLSDVNRGLDWVEIVKILHSEGFSVMTRPYYNYETELRTLFSVLHKKLVGANNITLIAVKTGL